MYSCFERFRFRLLFICLKSMILNKGEFDSMKINANLLSSVGKPEPAPETFYMEPVKNTQSQ